MSLEISIAFDKSAIERLKQIPVLMRLAPAERILKAMAKPIVSRGKSLAPRSRVSSGDSGPTRNKMSAKAKAKWPEEGSKHIRFVYRKGENGGYVVIGGDDPMANSFNFDGSEKGRRVFYWGKDQGRVKRVEPSQRFMMKAFVETRAEQVSAGNAQLEKELRELKIG